MIKLLVTVSTLFCALAGNAYAAPAKGGTCVAVGPMKNDLRFYCDHIGELTIKQIYEKGWRVVQSGNQLQDGTFLITYLVIEEAK